MSDQITLTSVSNSLTLKHETKTISLTQTVALSSGSAYIGTPTDGFWTDGLATILSTNTIADAVDAVNEAALGIVNGSYGFHTLKPATDVTYDLGDNTTPKRWRSLYLGPSSMHVSSTAAETTTARDYKWGIVTAAGGTQGYFALYEAGTVSPLLTVSPTGAAQLASTLGVTGAVTLSSTLGAGATTVTSLHASATLQVDGAATMAGIGATNITASGTLGVTGTSTLGATNTAAFTATTGSFSSTLGVTGTTTAAAVNATNITASGTLGVTGTSTLGAVNAGALSGTSGAFSTTLNVTGASTLAALSATTGAFSSTLAITGTTTAAAINATNITASGTLGVTGTSTLGATNTAALTATTGAFSSTLNVTGTSTLAATNTGAFTATTGSFSSTLGVTGNTTLTGTLTVNGGAGWFFGNTTIANLEPTPATVRYAARGFYNTLGGSAESAALYIRVDPSSSNPYFGIYGEVTSGQTDTHGGFIKIVHNGGGDAFYTASYGSGGVAYEAASYVNGSRGIISTLQRTSGGGSDFGNSTCFNAVWGDDGTGGATTAPNYGMYYAALSLGNSFRTRKQNGVATGMAEGRVEWSVSEYDLSRNRIEVYNTGETRLQSIVATVGAQNKDSAALHLVGSYYNSGTPLDKTTKLQTVVTAGVPALRISLGTLAAESLAAILSTTGLDMQGGTVTAGGTSAFAAATFSSTIAVTGTSTLANVSLGAANTITWSGRTIASSPADSVLLLTNNAASGFAGIKFGGTSTGQPYLKTNGAEFICRLADDSANTSLTALNLVASGTLGVTGTSTLGATNAAALTATSGNFSLALTCQANIITSAAGGSTSISPTGQYTWSSADGASRTPDTGLARVSAALVKATDGGGTNLGSLRVAAGSGSAPGLQVGASNDGAFQVSAGVIGLTGAGTEVARFGATLHQIPAAAIHTWNGRSTLQSTADGYVMLQNNAASDALVAFRFGGTSTSYPMWKRAASSTTLAARLADDSADAPVSCSNLTASGTASVGGKSVYTNLSRLGANDLNAQTDGYMYYVDHMLESASALYSAASSGTSNSTGLGLAGPRSDDSNTVNTASTDVQSHPGVMGSFTKSVGYANCHRSIAIAFAPDSGVTTAITLLFRTPAAVSDGTNDYTFYVGACITQGSSVAPVIRGWYIRYRHSDNSGKWQIGAVNSAAESESNTTTTVAFTANTWQTLVITLPPSGHNVSFSLTCAGVTSNLGTVSDVNMESPASQAISDIAGIAQVRNATDGTTFRAGYIDRVSVYASGMTGQGT